MNKNECINADWITIGYQERLLVENKLINLKLTKTKRTELVHRIRTIDNEKQHKIDAVSENEYILDQLIGKVKYLREHSPFR